MLSTVFGGAVPVTASLHDTTKQTYIWSIATRRPFQPMRPQRSRARAGRWWSITRLSASQLRLRPTEASRPRCVETAGSPTRRIRGAVRLKDRVERDAAAPGERAPITASSNARVADDDSLSGLQWDMAQIQAPEAHRVTGGSQSVLVGDIATGIDFNHPDLKPNIDGLVQLTQTHLQTTATPIDCPTAAQLAAYAPFPSANNDAPQTCQGTCNNNS